MRTIISSFGAVLMLASVTASPSAAQTQQSGSLNQAFSSCVDLARQRGWTESDIADNRRELRNFVARCIQGREARAQKQQKQKR
jgi:hypothetical protein